MDALRDLWVSSGFRDIETKEIAVSRTFSDFDEFWAGNVMANIKSMLSTLPQGDLERLKADVRGRLPKDASGRITVNARANAVKGRVP
jgi:hypothetical protein